MRFALVGLSIQKHCYDGMALYITFLHLRAFLLLRRMCIPAVNHLLEVEAVDKGVIC